MVATGSLVLGLVHNLSVQRQKDASPTKYSDQSIEEACYRSARILSPKAISIKPVQFQGGCSYSLHVEDSDLETCCRKDDTIVQFRDAKFDLDIATACKAREIYGSLVPVTIARGSATIVRQRRSVFEMTVVPGVRLSELLLKTQKLAKVEVERLERLLSGVADFLARGWKHTASARNVAQKQLLLMGRVGSTIDDRLQRLSNELPTPALRARAQSVLEATRTGALRALPVVLSHGDLIPSNIMVDPDSWKLNGVIDWAEAEYLPFGVALYGVEHLLGFMESPSGSSTCRWVWYEQAASLRLYFWSALQFEVSSLSDSELLQSVRVARDAGVLLWHGFAWDYGKIDRVVNEVDDGEELRILRAFLEVA